MKFSLIILAVITTYFLFAPIESVTAQTEGLVQLSQCSGTDCTACNIVHLANGVIKWLIGILFVVFAVLVAIAGIRLVVSGGNSRALDQAKETFINAIIGLLIILSAWLVIDTIMRVLIGNDGRLGAGGDVSGWLFWSEIECQTVYTPQEVDITTLNFDLETVSDFTAGGSNSYQAYVYDAVKNCKTVSNGSFPDVGMCQSALASVKASGPTYVVQECSGSAGTQPAPTWNNVASCGGGIDRPIGTGNTAIVAYAEQMRAKGCLYSQPLRNNCSGSPGYTDCSNLVDNAYRNAGCGSPGGTTAQQINAAVSIGNPADLRPGDALVYRSGGAGHVVICRDVGCRSVIHAKGKAYGIVIGNGASYYNDPKFRVIRASSMCR